MGRIYEKNSGRLLIEMLTDKILNSVLITNKKYKMFFGGEKILVGLSGGPDSVSLLHILDNFKDKFRFTLSAIYVDHMLRPDETPSEIEFCKSLCNKLSVQFFVKSVDVKNFAKEQNLNIQEAARQLRYYAYEEKAWEIKADKIALAHTADDQAETLLMRLFRGSGTTGLSGIPPVRKHFIRPLIEIERKEIEEFLEQNKIDYITDSSNMKKDYLRNRIRLTLMPLLKNINPDITTVLSRTTALFRDEERYFEIIVTKSLMKMISRKTNERIELFLSPFEVMDKVIARRVLRRVIDETKGLRGISFLNIEDIIDLVKNGKTGDRIYLPKGIRVIKDYSTLILTSEAPVVLGIYNVEIPGETLLKESGILLKSSIISKEEADNISKFGEGISFGLFDFDRLKMPLMIRPRKNGDFFYPSGFGRRKKIQDFFVDLKIPRDERDRIPLLISDENIVWVVEHRSDERFRIDENTKKVLRIDVKKARD